MGAWCLPARSATAGLSLTKVVAIYGDSLVGESIAQTTVDLGTRVSVVNRAVAGTAPCDWIPVLENDLATLHPKVVEVASSGETGAAGSCEQNPMNSSAMRADYQAALTTITQDVVAAGAQLVFVEEPPFLDSDRNAMGVQVAADEVALAYQYPHVSVSTAARKAFSTVTSGAYTAYAKCLSTETTAQGCDPVTHLIAIRAVSGAGVGFDLCPDSVTAGGCDEYSGGEVRFAKFLAVAAQQPKPLYGTKPIATPRVFVYGDSLLDESTPYMGLTSTAALSGTTGRVVGTIGQAPCDYLKMIFGSISLGTDLVVIESGANSNTACMLAPGSTKTHLAIGSTAWEQKYEADYDATFALAATYGVKVLVLDPPPMDPSQPAAAVRNDLMATVIPWLQADAAANYPLVSFASDARAAVGGDTFTPTLPCLPDETAAMGCSGGMITVRAPDGLHFCPTGLLNQTQPCGLPYDPGARRFGNAIAAVTRANF